MNEASLPHTRWDRACRIVWIPRYRRKVPCQQSRHEVGALVRGLFERKGCEVAGGSVRGDRVHACVRIPPKLAVSDVMGYARGKGAMVLRDRHPEWGKVVGRDKTFWARGHCVSTVGLNEEAIRRYVAEQEDGSRFEWGEVRARPFRGVPAGCRWPSRLQPQPVGSGTMCPPRSTQEKTSGYAGGSLFSKDARR